MSCIPVADRAVVSDDNQTIRLSSYRGREREPLATVELAPMSAIRLANELIAAALRHSARGHA